MNTSIVLRRALLSAAMMGFVAPRALAPVFVDQVVPIVNSALLSSKFFKKGTLKVYEKFPHGMCTTHAEVINADLLDFFKA